MITLSSQNKLIGIASKQEPEAKMKVLSDEFMPQQMHDRVPEADVKQNKLFTMEPYYEDLTTISRDDEMDENQSFIEEDGLPTSDEGKKGASAEKLPRDEKAQDHPLLYKLHYPRLNFSGTDRSPPKSNLKKKGKEIQKEEKEKRHNDKRKKTRQNAFDKRRMKLFTEQVLERQDEEVNLN